MPFRVFQNCVVLGPNTCVAFRPPGARRAPGGKTDLHLSVLTTLWGKTRIEQKTDWGFRSGTEFSKVRSLARNVWSFAPWRPPGAGWSKNYTFRSKAPLVRDPSCGSLRKKKRPERPHNKNNSWIGWKRPCSGLARHGGLRGHQRFRTEPVARRRDRCLAPMRGVRVSGLHRPSVYMCVCVGGDGLQRIAGLSLDAWKLQGISVPVRSGVPTYGDWSVAGTRMRCEPCTEK